MTKEVNFDEFKCRGSAIKMMMATGAAGQQISEKQLAELERLEKKEDISDKQKLEMVRLQGLKDNKGKVVLGDSCISYLMEWYAWKTQGMISVNKESLDMLQTKKGKMGEGAAVALLSIVDGELYQIDKQRVSNDYLSGEVDCFVGDSIYAAKKVADTKIAWDYPIFLRKIHNGLENGQKEQLQGYGDITTATDLSVANCLIDATDEIIDEMKWKVLRKINAATTESPEFLEEWPKWERSMKFSDVISINKRVFKIPVEPFTEFERQQVYDRVKFCREWLWKFDEMYSNMNL